MTSREAPDDAAARGWRSANLWAHTATFEENPVKQLLIPASVFTTVSGESAALSISNNYGTWPASTPDHPLDIATIWASLPAGTKVGDKVTEASWVTSSTIEGIAPEEVLESYQGAITFNEESDAAPGL